MTATDVSLPSGRADTEDVARAIHHGRPWADIAAAVGAGERTVKAFYRPRIRNRLLRWVDPDNAADPAHGTWQRAHQARQEGGCHPDGRVCDPCLAAHAAYQELCKRQRVGKAGLRTDDATVHEVAERLHAGASWSELAAERGRTTHYYQHVYRPLVQPHCLALVNRDQPSTTGREHGTKVKYGIDRCRCEPCRYANVTYNQRWEDKRRRGLVAYIDAEPTRARVRHLMGQGMGLKTIAARSGVSHGALAKLMYGDTTRNRAPTKRIRAATARRIRAVKPRLDDLADGARVPAEPTWARARALMDRGWTRTALGHAIGQAGPLQLSQHTVSARNARAIRDLDHAHPGPAPAWARPQPSGQAKRKLLREQHQEAA